MYHQAYSRVEPNIIKGTCISSWKNIPSDQAYAKLSKGTCISSWENVPSGICKVTQKALLVSRAGPSDRWAGTTARTSNPYFAKRSAAISGGKSESTEPSSSHIHTQWFSRGNSTRGKRLKLDFLTLIS